MIQLVLHAHMPYVLDSPMEYWLHEAVLHCYLPLIHVLRSSPRGRLVVHLSPSLINQWEEEAFLPRFLSYCSQRRALLEQFSLKKEVQSLWDEELYCLELYSNMLKKEDFYTLWKGLQNEGKIEILTGSATHPILPLWKESPWLLRQIRAGQKISAGWGAGTGFWFPECALDGDVLLAAQSCGLTHGYGDPSCCDGKEKVLRWEGFRLFIREREIGDLIWDAEKGYPCSSVYRDFHHDFFYEEGVKENQLPRGGFSLRAVGDRFSELKPYYSLEPAQNQALADARHFLRALKGAESCTLAFDAELFGHWWREGVLFLKNLFAEAAPSFFKLSSEMEGDTVEIKPKPSTWGTGCDASSWVNPSTAALWELLFQRQKEDSLPSEQRAFMLAQASDWPFLITHGSFAEDAYKTVERLLSSPPQKKDRLYHAVTCLEEQK